MMSIRSSEGEPGGGAELGGNVRADESPGGGRMMDRRSALKWIGAILGGGGVASLLLEPVKTDDPFAVSSLESLLGPPAPALAQTSPLLAVDTIFYDATGGGLVVQYMLNRGLYEARRSEVGFLVETVLFVRNNLGQTRAISPKIDPFTLIKTL